MSKHNLKTMSHHSHSRLLWPLLILLAVFSSKSSDAQCHRYGAPYARCYPPRVVIRPWFPRVRVWVAPPPVVLMRPRVWTPPPPPRYYQERPRYQDDDRNQPHQGSPNPDNYQNNNDDQYQKRYDESRDFDRRYREQTPATGASYQMADDPYQNARVLN